MLFKQNTGSAKYSKKTCDKSLDDKKSSRVCTLNVLTASVYYFPAKSIAVTNKKLISLKPKCKKKSKNILHKINKNKADFFRIANNSHGSKDNKHRSNL